MELTQVFAINTPEGVKTFATKQEAQDFLRRPKILAALAKLTGDNAELANWLIDNQETVEDAFDTGTIRRVSKSERNKLEKALAAIVEANNPKFAFVVDNHAEILQTFRWPSVKRMDDDAKAAAATETLNAVTENEELTAWILGSKDAILEAYEAGKEKRAPNPKAQEALAAYRAQKAAEKAAAGAGEAPTVAPEGE